MKILTRAAALVLLVCLILSLHTFPAAAASSNLLTNPGFESGTTGWTAANGGTLTAGTRVSTPKYSGSYAMKVTKPASKNWFDMVQNPLSAMKTYGNGKYNASCYIRGTSGQQVRLTIKLFMASGDTYLHSNVITLSSSWQKAEFVFSAMPDSYTRVEFYWTSPTGTTESDVTIYVDDCSLTFEEALSEAGMTSPDTTIVRPNKTLVGAIRWDAYFATSSSPKTYSISDQVARTLSYYPEQAPFFTQTRTPASGDVKLKFASAGVTYKIDDVTSSSLATRTINYTYGTSWESEVRYALNAGIDYFAYLWYNSEHADREHRQMALPHLAHSAQNGYLPDGRQMKMCAIISLGITGLGTPADLSGKTESQKLSAILRTRKELYQAMAQSSYLCITNSKGEIPVVFTYGVSSEKLSELKLVLEEAKFFTAWLAKKNPSKYRAISDIYFVAMTSSSVSYDKETELRTAGYSALSRYADNPGASSANADYQTLSIKRYAYNDLSLSSPTTGTAKSVGYARLSDANYAANDRYASIASRIGCVPLATTGWYCLPRIRTGVSWTNDYNWSYVRNGSAKEIAANVSRTLAWTDAHPDAARTNLMLIYAWNEHDEGGGLCPTVKTDSKGNIQTDAKGRPLANTALLDAVSTVLWNHKGQPLKNGDLNGDNKVTAADRVLLARTLADWNVEKWVVRLQCADVNGDGSVSTEDRTILSRYLAQWDDSYSRYF